MKIISKSLLWSSAFSLVLPQTAFASLSSAYASLVDTSQNQAFESRPAQFLKLAAVHFITNDGGLKFGSGNPGGQEFNPGDLCKSRGYLHKGCPAGYIPGEACTEDSSFVKECIDPDTWCRGNGYNVTSCTLPKYLSGKCPHSSTLYKSCETDNARACQDAGYASSCEVGKIGDRACPYDSKYKTCVCNPCAGFAYTSAQASAQGYVPGEVCNSCGTIKYKRTENACDGFKTCDCGGATGAKTCWSGTVKKFDTCKECCDTSKYKYDSSNCTGSNQLAGNSCGGKYDKCEAPCGSEYVYNESNCPSDKNFHCSKPCGDKYRDCKQLLFTGKTVYKNGMTYALNESDCPGTVKRFTVDNNTISNGLDHYTACTTADQTCADLAKSLDNRTNTSNTVEINLSKNMYCGNETLRNNNNWYGKVTTVINGNGHTITFDKVEGADIFVFDEGDITFKNAKIISKQTAVKDAGKDVCRMTSGVITRELVSRNTYYKGKVYFENVTVEAQAAIGDASTKGTCQFKRISGGTGGYYDLELGTPEIISGTLNINGFERSDNGYGTVVKGGTMNYKAKGKERVIFTFYKGTLNVCADKVLIMASSACESGTINSSTQDISVSDSCKSRVTVNYQPDLCQSSLFSGSFWN